MAPTKTPAEKAAEAAQQVKAKIDSFDEPFRDLGHRIHELILHSNPDLKPRIWYGMPGYALAASKPVLVFFRVDDGIFSIGVSEKANISVTAEAPDQLVGAAWYLQTLDEATENRIAAIVRRATTPPR